MAHHLYSESLSKTIKHGVFGCIIIMDDTKVLWQFGGDRLARIIVN